MLAITRNEDTHLQENIVLMNGSLGEVNRHGRSLRRKPQRDFIPRTLGKLYPDQSLQHSTLRKVHSILSYQGPFNQTRHYLEEHYFLANINPHF